MYSPIPWDPHERLGRSQDREAHPQKFFFSAATGKAFTTVFAGLAFTRTSLPNIIFFPALVAGFVRVLILAKPGMVKTPLFFTSTAPMRARLSMAWEATFLLSSHVPAIASAKPPFDMGRPVFFALTTAFMAGAFVAFMAAAFVATTFVARFGSILEKKGMECGKERVATSR